MKKAHIILLFIGLVLIISSCSSYKYTSNIKSSSFVPDKVRLELYNDDFKELGEVEISYDARRYFGIFNFLDSLNKEIVPPRQIESVKIAGVTDLSVNKYMRRAAVKAVETFPNADYFVPVYSKSTVLQMFLGKRTSEKMIIRAYELKDE